MPNVLITGAGRRAGIAAACALKLARSGWDVGLTCWRLYDRETGPASLVDAQTNLSIDPILTPPLAPTATIFWSHAIEISPHCP
jgi:NAD(P)-dependent dehydrogenase (short-subunit alcohol dehydrogenase family)